MLTVHANLNPQSRSTIPWLLDVQDDLLSGLATRVVVPLYRQQSATPSLTRLTPLLDFQGEAYVAMVPELAGVAVRDLGPSAGAVPQHRGQVTAALDLLFTGI